MALRDSLNALRNKAQGEATSLGSRMTSEVEAANAKQMAKQAAASPKKKKGKKKKISAENLNLSEMDIGGDFKKGLLEADPTARKFDATPKGDFIKGAMGNFDAQQSPTSSNSFIQGAVNKLNTPKVKRNKGGIRGALGSLFN